MSHIKGSTESLKCPTGRLSLQEYPFVDALTYIFTITRYLSFPAKKCSLSESQRQRVYQIYERYEALKRGFYDHDICDVVFHIYREISVGKIKVPSVDFVYIDEVQVCRAILCAHASITLLC